MWKNNEIKLHFQCPLLDKRHVKNNVVLPAEAAHEVICDGGGTGRSGKKVLAILIMLLLVADIGLITFRMEMFNLKRGRAFV